MSPQTPTPSPVAQTSSIGGVPLAPPMAQNGLPQGISGASPSQIASINPMQLMMGFAINEALTTGKIDNVMRIKDLLIPPAQQEKASQSANAVQEVQTLGNLWKQAGGGNPVSRVLAEIPGTPQHVYQSRLSQTAAAIANATGQDPNAVLKGLPQLYDPEPLAGMKFAGTERMLKASYGNALQTAPLTPGLSNPYLSSLSAGQPSPTGLTGLAQ